MVGVMRKGVCDYAVQIAQKNKKYSPVYYNLTHMYYNLTCMYNRIVILCILPL